MSLINVQNLTFGYDGGSEPVFDNVSLQIDTEWKLGLIGRNGRGKTTFLNLLAGKYEYGGTISSNVRFSYSPFTVKGAERQALDVINEVCPCAEDWEIIRELSYLNADAELLYRPFEKLSKGEQIKLLLAGLFLNDGNFLLLDEPVNHLDIEGREIVAEYLKRKKGFILVSHDRAFLDGCVDHILSINRTDIELQSGNFSSFFDNFEKRQAFEAAQSERLKKDIARLDGAVRRTSVWADRAEASKYGKNSSGLKPDKGYVGHKSAKLMKRAKICEARRTAATEEKRELLKNTETSESLKLFPLQYRAERVLDLKEVQICYGGRDVCPPVSFGLLRGERAVLDGKNGCGKSSILKAVLGLHTEYTGTVTVPSGLVISYVPQTANGLEGSVFAFAEQYGLDESLFLAILSKMDLDKRHFDGDMRTFSEGQKKKVLIAKSLCERAHLYIWDEPLNYIDIYSRIQIENLISEFKPTMLFVEHDRAFRDGVATKIIKI